MRDQKHDGAGWHADIDDLRAYVRGELKAPRLWSVDAHLVACAPCRLALAEAGDPIALDAGWERLDAEPDAPRPGVFEGLLTRLGVADHTARLLAATPVLRASWLGAVLLVLAMTVVCVHRGVTRPVPRAGPAAAPGRGGAFVGPALDPTYEMVLVAPLHGFRLLMIRTVAVLITSLGLNGLATLALPGYGLRALAWLLPALALTATGLALTAWLGSVRAPPSSAVAGSSCWWSPRRPSTGRSSPSPEWTRSWRRRSR
jgi:hypothetical protein